MSKTYPIKLVRDEIESDVGGGTIVYQSADPGLRLRLLRRKLIEEALEYLEEPSVSELADVLAVVNALATVDLRVDHSTLMQAVEDKHKRRGGFEKGTIMSILKD